MSLLITNLVVLVFVRPDKFNVPLEAKYRVTTVMLTLNTLFLMVTLSALIKG